MAEKRALFSIAENQQVLRSAAAVLIGLPKDDARRSKANLLGQTLQIIASNAHAFDETCQLNVRWIGEQLLSYLRQFSGIDELPDLDLVVGIVYRFILEYDISITGDLSFELNAFKNLVIDQCETFGPDAIAQVRYARRDMPLSMLKAMLNSEDLSNLRDVPAVAKQTNQKIEEWRLALGASEKKVGELQATLLEQKNAFNFVGLNEGFSRLSEQVSEDLEAARKSMVFFGVLLLMPAGIDLWSLLSGALDVGKVNFMGVALVAVATVTVTLLLLYFFRIALRSADGSKAQLVQLRLRMALCAFIQSYADYSKEIKSGNPDALNKFEALIFSGLVVTPEKLPSTFDGVEQLTGLLKSFSTRA